MLSVFLLLCLCFLNVGRIKYMDQRNIWMVSVIICCVSSNGATAVQKRGRLSYIETSMSDDLVPHPPLRLSAIPFPPPRRTHQNPVADPPRHCHLPVPAAPTRPHLPHRPAQCASAARLKLIGRRRPQAAGEAGPARGHRQAQAPASPPVRPGPPPATTKKKKENKTQPIKLGRAC